MYSQAIKLRLPPVMMVSSEGNMASKRGSKARAASVSSSCNASEPSSSVRWLRMSRSCSLTVALIAVTVS
ncbi:hypothetical protein D3C86_2260230 [compost metagenome]